jgi:hypothetical protein
MAFPWPDLWFPVMRGTALTWAQYLVITGFMVGALGVGVAWGQFRLGWKEIIDASTA